MKVVIIRFHEIRSQIMIRIISEMGQISSKIAWNSSFEICQQLYTYFKVTQIYFLWNGNKLKKRKNNDLQTNEREKEKKEEKNFWKTWWRTRTLLFHRQSTQKCYCIQFSSTKTEKDSIVVTISIRYLRKIIWITHRPFFFSLSNFAKLRTSHKVTLGFVLFIFISSFQS